MDKLQIAHDLAVAKSVKDGSDAKEIVRLYHEYNEKFLNILEQNKLKQVAQVLLKIRFGLVVKTVPFYMH